MKPKTDAALQELAKVEWFRAIGRSDGGGVKVLSSWMEAILSCAGSRWKTVQHDAVYLYKREVHDKLCGLSEQQRRERDFNAIRQEVEQGGMISGSYLQFEFSQWDRIREGLLPDVDLLVRRKTESIIAREGLPEVFQQRVTWDILCLAMECEFGDVVPGSFFTANSRYYAKGHFPCGWDGDFPDGQLIVF